MKKTKANGSKRHRSNPTAKNHHRRRRNPSGIGAALGSPTDLLKSGLAGLASALATRQLPQALLGANNSGAWGYAANAATALAATWLGSAFLGASAGKGALIGGTVIILDRILAENVSPIGPYLQLSGVGDATAYGKLGTIRTGYYTHPGINNPDGSLYVPDPYTAAAVQAVVARYPQVAQVLPASAAGGTLGAVNPSSLRRHTASGVLLSSRFQGRFNQAA